MKKTRLSILALLLAWILAKDVRAQGCVATGASGMMFGTPGLASHASESSPAPSSEPEMSGGYLGGWQATVGYRYFQSHRHFVGSTEQTQREEEGSEVVNNNNLLDFSLTRVISPRWSLTLGLPFLMATRWSPLRTGGVVTGRDVTQSSGIGDLRLIANRWMLNPSKYTASNFALGLGVKLPTGKSDVTDDVKTSPTAAPVTRSVDQSIQPGDGGTGIILALQGFHMLSHRLTLFADGTYLINPRGNNGVSTGRSRPSEGTMSVADQYLARLGVAAAVWRRAGLATSLGLRLEGIPVEDLMGPSDGFRRPGFTASIEPGVVWSWSFLTTTLSVPVAFHRERQQSVTDRIDGRHGDAAFADYSILISQSFRY